MTDRDPPARTPLAGASSLKRIGSRAGAAAGGQAEPRQLLRPVTPLRKSHVPAFRMNQKIVVGAVFVTAMFMNIMDITIVNVALPTIGRDFNIPPTAVDGVVIAYLVSLAVFIPASGWLGDRFGGKRVLLTAIVVFTVGSALCGIAQNETQLVLFRII